MIEHELSMESYDLVAIGGRGSLLVVLDPRVSPRQREMLLPHLELALPEDAPDVHALAFPHGSTMQMEHATYAEYAPIGTTQPQALIYQLIGALQHEHR